MLKLAIVEDTEDIREALESYFSKQKEIQLLIASPNAEEFLCNIAVGTIDILLCDIGLPGISGVELVWRLKQIHPKIHIVMFTVFDEEDYIFQSLKAGASGYLLKNTSLKEIKEGLIDVNNGGASMSPQIAKKVINYFNERGAIKKDISNIFSDKELLIIKQAQKGYNNRQIAEEMFVSIDTIKYHIKNIYRQLEVNNRQELNKFYSHLG
ncbi:hypothetical protein A5893_11000 [Pedobacter psychrophilus]|uniref:DNA-binding response regulator n=1 Tax=Pedobacter psychrophilus TaxID=1826909 RepID=A0A179DDS3_9SPHI|nr:response regulator transcription factor [Pedobacter psychrophilus]OAQ39186.1 hypothetical protein A5893_11000 [Pedobacter psychrophilus]